MRIDVEAGEDIIAFQKLPKGASNHVEDKSSTCSAPSGIDGRVMEYGSVETRNVNEEDYGTKDNDTADEHDLVEWTFAKVSPDGLKGVAVIVSRKDQHHGHGQKCGSARLLDGAAVRT